MYIFVDILFPFYQLLTVKFLLDFALGPKLDVPNPFQVLSWSVASMCVICGVAMGVAVAHVSQRLFIPVADYTDWMNCAFTLDDLLKHFGC